MDAREHPMRDETEAPPRAPPRHVGRRGRRRGASTRSTSTRAARRSPSEMLELTAPRPGRARARAGVRAGRRSGWRRRRSSAPGGEVVLSDVVPEMTAIAAARAEALGLDNVSTCVLDLEQIDQPDDSYDVVLCREGLMFAADPARAAGEIRRVLRPGGRVALAVWGPRERNPWLGHRVRRGERAARHARSSARHSRTVLARRRRQLAAHCSRATGFDGVVVDEVSDAAAGRLVRRMVVADVVARRTAHDDPRRPARRC